MNRSILLVILFVGLSYTVNAQDNEIATKSIYDLSINEPDSIGVHNDFNMQEIMTKAGRELEMAGIYQSISIGALFLSGIVGGIMLAKDASAAGIGIVSAGGLISLGCQTAAISYTIKAGRRMQNKRTKMYTYRNDTILERE